MSDPIRSAFEARLAFFEKNPLARTELNNPTSVGADWRNKLKLFQDGYQAAKAEREEAVIIVGEYMPLKLADKLRELPFGTKLYTSPLTAQAAAEEMKRKCVEACIQWANYEIHNPDETGIRIGAMKCMEAIEAIPTES